jgi:putative pyruvate formate lyase activating enzyme
MNYVNCNLCPRLCGVDRTQGKVGFCKAPAAAVVSKTMLHKWEEPVLAPNGKSGAIFFGGCNLGCIYCQNYAISRTPQGKLLDGSALRAEMETLIAQGAENIDLVSPTPYLPTVLEALEMPLSVPVVYNTGGYERLEAISALKSKVDIYLPDLKYADNGLAKSLSAAPDYFEVATGAIREMVSQVGRPKFAGDKLVKGVVLRHLILPGQIENSLKVLDWIGDTFAPGEVLVSLMRQYTPTPGMKPPFDRSVTEEEYDAVLSWMYLNDIEGFTQEATSSGTSFIPDF